MTLFRSVKDAFTYPDWVLDGTWDDVAAALTEFHLTSNKEDIELFNLWEFKSENYEEGRRAIYRGGQHTGEFDIIAGSIRRCKANAIGAWGLVLDYDGHKTIDEACEELDGLTYALYTTFRHSKEINKFRVVLPFDRILDRDDFGIKKDDISACFPFADYASFSESQSFYLHSGPDQSQAVAFYRTGTFLNPDYFINTPPPEVKTQVYTEFTGDPNRYKQTLMKSLQTCRGLHYNGPHKFNVLTLVSLCKSAGCSFEEYDSLCYSIADPESGLMEARQRRIAWDGWGASYGVTKQKREEFIAGHGGISYFNENDWRKLRTKIAEKYKTKKELNDDTN